MTAGQQVLGHIGEPGTECRIGEIGAHSEEQDRADAVWQSADHRDDGQSSSGCEYSGDVESAYRPLGKCAHLFGDAHPRRGGSHEIQDAQRYDGERSKDEEASGCGGSGVLGGGRDGHEYQHPC